MERAKYPYFTGNMLRGLRTKTYSTNLPGVWHTMVGVGKQGGRGKGFHMIRKMRDEPLWRRICGPRAHMEDSIEAAFLKKHYRV